VRSDASANRAALVSAAIDLLADRGPAVPLSMIAEQAEVGIATLYRRFPTRESLLKGVILELRDRIVDLVEDYLPRLHSDPEDSWNELVHALAAMRPGAIGQALASTDLARSSEAIRLRSDLQRALVEAVALAQDAGVVRPDVTAARFLVGLAVVTRPRPTLRGESVEPEIEAQLVGHLGWLTDVYVRGLRPDPAP